MLPGQGHHASAKSWVGTRIYVVLAAMASTCTLLYRNVKRRGWL